MRAILLLLAILTLPQCASADQNAAPAEPVAQVIIGVAKSSNNRGPVYAVLWRLLDAERRFTDYDDARAIEARTNAGDTIRVSDLPGEFAVVTVTPGTYALDSVFAQLNERGVSYIAQGAIAGPARPAFDIRAGETVYLGIWETDIDGANAVTRLWRLDEADARAVARASRRPLGRITVRQTYEVQTPCAPHPISNLTQRQIC